jgi:Zn-dependent protease
MLSYGHELLVAAAGPLFNLFLAVALIPALHGAEGEATFCFFAINLLSAFFNLLPIVGFDGGRVLFCISSLLFPSRFARGFCELVSLFFLLLFYFGALFIFLCENGGEYSFLLSLFLLYGEGVRAGVLTRDFASICEKNSGFGRKGRKARAGDG